MSSSVPAPVSAPTGSAAVAAINASAPSSVPGSTGVVVSQTTSTASFFPGMDWMQMGLPVLFMVAIYWLVIRPNNNKLEEQKKMVETLKVGDEVVTASGLMGIISELKQEHIMLKVADALVLMFQRQSVQHVLPKGTVKFSASSKHGR